MRTTPFACHLLLAAFAALTLEAAAGEYHVSVAGDDGNAGTVAKPFRTIQHAGDVAQPGDVITVHAGVYRERINPPRGGVSDAQRITYQAAPGESVVITGSEIVTKWEPVTNATWRAVIPNSFFGAFNPYADLIHGDWYGGRRPNHTGAVYVHGDWLREAVQLEDVLAPVGETPLWFGVVSNGTTVIWAQFKEGHPNAGQVEINVRRTVFTPEKTGINYLTVRGFDLRNAATPWAPPSAGQIGIVSAYWCKGWIIESNEISHATCCGVALGKYSDEFDNTNDKGAADPYTACVRRALTNGWNKATVGSHVVRHNHIHDCEQTGIVGSLGCSFSTVTGNDIHDIHVRHLFGGAEMAGVKFHGAIDVVIRGNHIYRCGDVAGVWLDWMAQNAQVTGNLMHDNTGSCGDIFLEMQHGPILVANNLLLSRRMAFVLNSQGIAFVHNLIAGPVRHVRGDGRQTPFQKVHATDFGGIYRASDGDSGDDRFYNNLCMAAGDLRPMGQLALPCFTGGNVFAGSARAPASDATALLRPDFDAGVKLEPRADGWYLELAEDPAWREGVTRPLVTTELLGRAKVSGGAYENPDGSPLRIDTDYLGQARDEKNPFPGPFEKVGTGKRLVKVWPVDVSPAGN